MIKQQYNKKHCLVKSLWSSWVKLAKLGMISCRGDVRSPTISYLLYSLHLVYFDKMASWLHIQRIENAHYIHGLLLPCVRFSCCPLWVSTLFCDAAQLITHLPLTSDANVPAASEEPLWRVQGAGLSSLCISLFFAAITPCLALPHISYAMLSLNLHLKSNQI